MVKMEELEKHLDVHIRLCNLIGERDYEVYSKSKYEVLKMKLGLLMFGVPEKVLELEGAETLLNVIFLDKLGFKEKEFESIEAYFSLILAVLKPEEEIKAGFLFISIERDGAIIPLPMVRLYMPNNEVKFIDMMGRVYRDWDDFLTWNKLPPCDMCYPPNGVYRKMNDVDVPILSMGKSRSASMRSKVVDRLDQANLVLGVAGTIGTLIAPPLGGPLLFSSVASGGVAGAYVAGRSVYNLRDRNRHWQTLNPGDKEALIAWVGTLVGALGMVGSVASIFKAVRGLRAIPTARTGVRAMVALDCGFSLLNFAGKRVPTINCRGEDEAYYCMVQNFLSLTIFITVKEAEKLIGMICEQNGISLWRGYLSSLTEVGDSALKRRFPNTDMVKVISAQREGYMERRDVIKRLCLSLVNLNLEPYQFDLISAAVFTLGSLVRGETFERLLELMDAVVEAISSSRNVSDFKELIGIWHKTADRVKLAWDRMSDMKSVEAKREEIMSQVMEASFDCSLARVTYLLFLPGRGERVREMALSEFAAFAFNPSFELKTIEDSLPNLQSHELQDGACLYKIELSP